MRGVLVSLILVLGLFGSSHVEERPQPVLPDEPLEAGDLTVLDGFQARSLAEDLQFPVAIEWDDEGGLYLATAGFAYGLDGFQGPQVLRLEDDGSTTVVAEGFSPPLIDITWHDGRLYVSERANITIVDPADGSKETLVGGLPAQGDHHTNEISFGPDGRLYVPVGIATNALVVGIENLLPGFGWLRNITEFSDVPCEDVELAGVNHVTRNPFRVEEEPINMSAVVVEYASEDEIPEWAWGVDGENVTTGAYVPFGTPTYRGQVIEGDDRCTGSVLAIGEDGDVSWHAWGFRNPYGLKFDDEGTMWVTQNGADVRGSRPIQGSADRLWRVEEGAWYGYSDHDGGVPIDDVRFAPPGEDHFKRLLLEDPSPPPPPAMNFSVHAAVTKFDFAPGGQWGDGRTFYLALYGDHAPATGPPGEHSGHKVVRSHLDDLDEQALETVVAGAFDIDRRFRPVEAAFGPDGNLYVVNIGVVDIERLPVGPDANPRNGTGALYVLEPAEDQDVPAPGALAVVLLALLLWRRRT